MEIENVLTKNRVIPVALFDSMDIACRTTEILLNNSIDIVEVTLRTAGALDIISELSEKFPEMVVGAGSVLSIFDIDKLSKYNIKFAFSPVADVEVLDRAKELAISLIPGVSTPGELNLALKYSSLIKIFPAEHLGGIKYLKAIIAPFKMKDFSLIPTGGISMDNYLGWLKVERVISCGMSYIVDKKVLDSGDWSEIERRVKAISRELKEHVL